MPSLKGCTRLLQPEGVHEQSNGWRVLAFQHSGHGLAAALRLRGEEALARSRPAGALAEGLHQAAAATGPQSL